MWTCSLEKCCRLLSYPTTYCVSTCYLQAGLLPITKVTDFKVDISCSLTQSIIRCLLSLSDHCSHMKGRQNCFDQNMIRFVNQAFNGKCKGFGVYKMCSSNLMNCYCSGLCFVLTCYSSNKIPSEDRNGEIS